MLIPSINNLVLPLAAKKVNRKSASDATGVKLLGLGISILTSFSL